jgi:hypothetical protein
MADPHGWILRVIYPKSTSDLLRAPSRRPSPALPVNGTSFLPYHLGTIKADTSLIHDLASKTLLHIGAQSGIGRHFARPTSLGCAICVPLGRAGSIIQIAASGRGIASHFP